MRLGVVSREKVTGFGFTDGGASVYCLLAVRGIGTAERNAIDREQLHAQVTHLSQQSMQRGLIHDPASYERLAVLFLGDGQTPKPVCPLTTQMTLEPDVIDPGLIWIAVECV